MPDKSDEVSFSYNTNAFEQGFLKIYKGLNRMARKARIAAKRMNRSFNKIKKSVDNITNPIKKIAGKIISPFKKLFSFMGKLKGKTQDVSGAVTKGLGNFALKAGIVGLALKGVQGILSNMPEVGEAFGIAKDIFLKNLLFPLRKAVFPLLQKLVDWVRDNRTQFVKWGAALVNVFTTVVRAVKRLVSIGKTLVSSFSGFFEKLFGDRIKNLEDLFNVFAFKFSVITIYVQGLVEKLLERVAPLFDTLGDIVISITEGIVGMVKGFVEGFSEIDKQSDILGNLNDLFKAFLELVEDVTPLMEPLGKLLGKVFGITLLTAFRALESVLLSITGLIALVQGEISGAEFLERLKTKGLGEMFTGGGKEERVNDAIIKPDGTIIRTNPADTLIATKTPEALLSDRPGGGSRSVTVTGTTIDFTGMQIIMNGGTTEEAQAVGESLVDVISNRLNREIERSGG